MSKLTTIKKMAAVALTAAAVLGVTTAGVHAATQYQKTILLNSGTNVNVSSTKDYVSTGFNVFNKADHTHNLKITNVTKGGKLKDTFERQTTTGIYVAAVSVVNIQLTQSNLSRTLNYYAGNCNKDYYRCRLWTTDAAYSTTYWEDKFPY